MMDHVSDSWNFFHGLVSQRLQACFHVALLEESGTFLSPNQQNGAFDAVQEFKCLYDVKWLGGGGAVKAVELPFPSPVALLFNSMVCQMHGHLRLEPRVIPLQLFCGFLRG